MAVRRLKRTAVFGGNAVGDMPPAGVRIIRAGVNPAVVTKPAGRGSFQTVGIVTDVGLFVE